MIQAADALHSSESSETALRTRPNLQAMALLCGLMALMSLMLVACSTSGQETGSSRPEAPGQLSSPEQSNEGGQVTISVTWRGPESGPVFVVVMDTHSVDLDSYDLQGLAVLRTGDGKELRPSGWDAPKGGHHRKGTLTFPATAVDGSPLIGSATHALKLVIRDIAGVPERVFQWEF